MHVGVGGQSQRSSSVRHLVVWISSSVKIEEPWALESSGKWTASDGESHELARGRDLESGQKFFKNKFGARNSPYILLRLNEQNSNSNHILQND